MPPNQNTHGHPSQAFIKDHGWVQVLQKYPLCHTGLVNMRRVKTEAWPRTSHLKGRKVGKNKFPSRMSRDDSGCSPMVSFWLSSNLLCRELYLNSRASALLKKVKNSDNYFTKSPWHTLRDTSSFGTMTWLYQETGLKFPGKEEWSLNLGYWAGLKSPFWSQGQ